MDINSTVAIYVTNDNEIVYELTSEDMSNVGGRMGTEFSTENYKKLFKKIESAKKYAEDEYGEEIEWDKDKDCIYADCGYVMYTIKSVTKPIIY